MITKAVDINGSPMKEKGDTAMILMPFLEGLTDGEEIQQVARKAGVELITEGKMHPETLEKISQPLISEEDLRQRYNKLL